MKTDAIKRGETVAVGGTIFSCCARCGTVREITAMSDRETVAYLESVLRRLVTLKDEKDLRGQTRHYLAEMPKAWAAARAAIGSGEPR